MQNRRKMLFAGLAGFTLVGCTGLQALNLVNALTPGDFGVEEAELGAPFGADPRQRLDVYVPKGAKSPAPVLVFFYGGGWAGGRRQDYRFIADAFASRGYVVIVPDYRLAPAFTYPAFVEDGANAIRWVKDNVSHYGGDPARVAVAGHSAGAYIAIMLALDRRWLKQAGAPDAIRAVISLAGPYDFYPFDIPESKQAFAGAPNPLETQPIRYARADAPPALLITGDKDKVVFPRNAYRLTDALRRAGARVDLKVYRGLNHVDVVTALSKPFRGKATILSDSLKFLDSTLN